MAIASAHRSRDPYWRIVICRSPLPLTTPVELRLTRGQLLGAILLVAALAMLQLVWFAPIARDDGALTTARAQVSSLQWSDQDRDSLTGRLLEVQSRLGHMTAVYNDLSAQLGHRLIAPPARTQPLPILSFTLYGSREGP